VILPVSGHRFDFVPTLLSLQRKKGVGKPSTQPRCIVAISFSSSSKRLMLKAWWGQQKSRSSEQVMWDSPATKATGMAWISSSLDWCAPPLDCCACTTKCWPHDDAGFVGL